MDYQNFIYNLSELFIYDDDALNDEDLIAWIMSIGEPSFYSIKLMKERGNSLFKKGNIILAGSLYKQALNFLCFVGLLPTCDEQAIASLAQSLVLNLAACELKLSHYDLASRFCKFVLHFDPSNVKALYRRGLACKRLNQLNVLVALEDFEHVLRLDPDNSDASRELIDVVEKLAVNPNGKRVAFPFDPLGSNNKGKKPLLSVDMADKSVVATSCTASCSTERQINVLSCNQDFMASESNPPSDSDSMDTFSHSESNPPPDLESMDASSQGCTEKPAQFSFSAKKRALHTLNISPQDYDKLLAGKDLSFYHAGSLSYMRVRPLIPENSIQTGTLHEDVSWAAEVPHSPSPKELVEHSTLTPEGNTLVTEDVVFQISKKKRVSSGSAQVSKVSAVQFQFVAVRENKNKSCRRTINYSHCRSPRIAAGIHLKKRSSVSVDYSVFLCRFNKKDALITRAKRKETDLFYFDSFYHPPHKKCRLTVSAFLTCFSSSISSSSTSLTYPGTPGFVL